MGLGDHTHAQIEEQSTRDRETEGQSALSLKSPHPPSLNGEQPGHSPSRRTHLDVTVGGPFSGRGPIPG